MENSRFIEKRNYYNYVHSSNIRKLILNYMVPVTRIDLRSDLLSNDQNWLFSTRVNSHNLFLVFLITLGRSGFMHFIKIERWHVSHDWYQHRHCHLANIADIFCEKTLRHHFVNYLHIESNFSTQSVGWGWNLRYCLIQLQSCWY